jgi:hypothetical protein
MIMAFEEYHALNARRAGFNGWLYRATSRGEVG